MIFIETKLRGAFLIKLEKLEDERGFFARTWCERELSEHGLNSRLVECSVSYNRKRGTLRGMHYQVYPNEEVKIVHCVRGAIYDVIIDLRRDSPTYTQWFSVALNVENRLMLYVPEKFAHGFQTIEDNTDVFYQISEFYAPDQARSVRWNDPRFQIRWPDNNPTLSERDRLVPDFVP